MDALVFQVKDELGFCTRLQDGVSGMTVTALANFCGTKQAVITNLLNRIRDCDPISNDLSHSLKPYAGKDWRLISNDEQTQSVFIIDEVCHAILEYYAGYSIGWHADNESSMGVHPAITSISFGAIRKFQIKPIGGKITDFWLEHGSLLIMHPGCQSTHLHQVPKTKKLVGCRINLTFRPHIGGKK